MKFRRGLKYNDSRYYSRDPIIAVILVDPQTRYLKENLLLLEDCVKIPRDL